MKNKTLKSKLRTAITYPIVATMLLTGCSSVSYSNRGSSRVVRSTQYIPTMNERPHSLEEMMAASGRANEAMQFSRRFEDIKSGIGHKSNYGSNQRSSYIYNPRRDIRQLVYDIEHSDIRNRSQMASTVKNFTYYRTDTIVKERRFQHQTTSLFLATLTGAGVYYAKQQEIERNGDTDDSPDAEAVISGVVSYFLWNFILDSFGDRTDKTIRKTYRINPYYGTQKKR